MMDYPIYSNENTSMISILDNIVFLDIETSGLDVANSEILEIGAIKISNGKVEVFETLIKNKKNIPIEIFSLCSGLAEDDLKNAPTLEGVSDYLKEFLGNHCIIAHNAKFEREFINFHIPKIKNKIIDSMELVAILEPYHKGYNLDYLKNILTNDKNREKHRALSDAEDTLKVVNAILARLYKKEATTIEPITFKINSYLNSFGLENWEWSKHLDNINSDLIPKTDVIYEDEQSDNKDKNISIEKGILSKIYKNDKAYEELLKDETIWKSKEGFTYEYRPGQYELAKTIRELFSRSVDTGKIACIEAPTGIGKSVGYLLPAIIEARINKKRIIVSTNTKELQIQLINKDIPNILESLGLTNKVSYGYIKGKNNYICKQRLDSYKSDLDSLNPTKSDIMSIIYLDRLIEEGKYGDIEEINYWILENFISLKKHLIHVSCDPNSCRPKKCSKECLYKSRIEELKQEDITVINHSLLAKWPYKEEKPLENIIVDEAHNLTEKGYEFFSKVVDSKVLKYLLEEIYPYDFIGNSKFIYNNTKTKLRRIKPFDRFYSYIKIDRNLKEKISRSINFIVEEIDYILEFGTKNYRNLNEYNLNWEINLQKDEIIKKVLKNGNYQDITFDNYSTQIKSSCEKIISNLTSIIIKINRYLDDDSLDKESDIYVFGKSRVTEIEEIKDNLVGFLEYSKEDDFARIADIDKQFDNFEFTIVPLKLATLFEENILNKVESAIFLSATLSVDNNMNYFKDILGINRVKNVSQIIEPIYDYKSRVKVIGINDICSYNNTSFISEIGDILGNTYKVIDGNILSLFNSKGRQEGTYHELKSRDSSKSIPTYMNKKGVKYITNIDNMKSIVLGSKGCFEGVDVPGDGLTCVTLDKIPNLSPQNPLYYSIMKKYKKRYNEINYPQMSIKIKQALGRLLRSKYDYGCFIIFDVGTNVKNLKRLEKELHGCNINMLGQESIYSFIGVHLNICRLNVIKTAIIDILNLPDLKNEENMNIIKEKINIHLRNRCIDSKVYYVDEDEKIFKIEYFGKKYLINKNQFNLDL